MERRESKDVKQLESVSKGEWKRPRTRMQFSTIAAGGLMATPIQGRTRNPFLFVAYALVALSLWMVDRGIGGRSAQPTSSSLRSDMPGAGPQHGETYASFVLPQNDRLYLTANSVSEQLAANESSSAENNDQEENNRQRAALAFMVYLATDGIRR
jgi:hypothetical protein